MSEAVLAHPARAASAISTTARKGLKVMDISNLISWLLPEPMLVEPIVASRRRWSPLPDKPEIDQLNATIVSRLGIGWVQGPFLPDANGVEAIRGDGEGRGQRLCDGVGAFLT